MNPPREHGLDVLRALAIVSVLAFHTADLGTPPAWLAPLLAYGWMGVDVFFVLSGFLIGRQGFASQGVAGPALRAFWIKRWLRTLPLYYLVLFVNVVVKPIVFHFPFHDDPWPFLIFAQNFGPPRDFVASWSLCVEEQFYLVFPLIAIGLRSAMVRMSAAIWLAPLVGSAVARWVIVVFFWHHYPGSEFVERLQWPTYTHLDGLACGIFLAATEARWKVFSGRRRLACAVAGVLLWLGTAAAFGSHPDRSIAGMVLTFLAISVAFALLLIGVRGVRLRPLAHRVVSFVALTSYGAYLWHLLLIRVVDRSGLQTAGWGVRAALFFATTFLVAYATYRIVEKPALGLRDRLLHRAAAEPAEVVGSS